MLSHAVGVMLSHELELLDELVLVQDLNFLLDLTDHILELVVDEGHSVAVLSMLDHLVGNRGS